VTDRQKNILKNAGRWLLIAAAYSFLVWKLVTYDNWVALGSHLSEATALQYMLLLGALLLVPVNLGAEALKWQYLLHTLVPVSFPEAYKQVCYGYLGAIVTPARLGDYPARASLLHENKFRLPAITLGFVGSFALMLVMIVFGLLALIIAGVEITDVDRDTLYVVALSVVVIICITLMWGMPVIMKKLAKREIKNERWKLLIRTMAEFSNADFAKVTALSLLRYLIYCFQLWLALRFCGVDLSLHQMEMAIPIYYMILTLLPSLSVADMAIRGSVSIIVFSAFTSNTAGVAIAAMLIWLLNTMLPTVFGSVVKTTIKQDNKENN